MKTWEFALALFLLLTLVGMAQDRPDPHDPSSRCMPPDVVKNYGPAPWTLIPCTCHQECILPDPESGILEPWVREDPTCSKWCAKEFCVCHPDDNPCAMMPEVKP